MHVACMYDTELIKADDKWYHMETRVAWLSNNVIHLYSELTKLAKIILTTTNFIWCP